MQTIFHIVVCLCNMKLKAKGNVWWDETIGKWEGELAALGYNQNTLL